MVFSDWEHLDRTLYYIVFLGLPSRTCTAVIHFEYFTFCSSMKWKKGLFVLFRLQFEYLALFHSSMHKPFFHDGPIPAMNQSAQLNVGEEPKAHPLYK